MPKPLTQNEIEEAMTGLPEWRIESGKLLKAWNFASFLEAMQFVNRVALIAESINHHPDIDIRYKQVTLTLWSHDAGGITPRDLRLASLLAGRVSEKE